MNKVLRAIDLLACRWVCVNAFDRRRDVATECDDPPRIFIVVGDDRQLMGLVEERQAALFPTRVFADLVVRRPPPAVSSDTPVEEVLIALDSTTSEYIPVAGENGILLGVISRARSL